MARINLEDSIFKDDRFIRLCISCGDKEKALGALISMWIVAQKHYLKSREIPNEDWVNQGLNEKLIEVGLAERTETGVRTKGQDEQFSWLLDKSEAGRRGGKKSAESRQKKYGTSQPKPEASDSNLPKHTESRRSTPKPPSPSPSPSPSLTSLSEFSSEGPAGAPAPHGQQEISPGSLVFQEYSKAFHERYGVLPKRNATVNAQSSNLAKRLGVSDACQVVRFYLRHNDGFFLKQQHSLGLCLAQAEGLFTQWQRGKAVTSSDVKQFEKTDQVRSQLERIKNGEL